jgi:hypothetical protein
VLFNAFDSTTMMAGSAAQADPNHQKPWQLSKISDLFAVLKPSFSGPAVFSGQFYKMGQQSAQ